MPIELGGSLDDDANTPPPVADVPVIPPSQPEVSIEEPTPVPDPPIEEEG